MASSDEEGAFESADEGESEMNVKETGESDIKGDSKDIMEVKSEGEKLAGEKAQEDSKRNVLQSGEEGCDAENEQSGSDAIITAADTKNPTTSQTDIVQEEEIENSAEKQSNEGRTEMSLEEPIGNVILERTPPEKTIAEIEHEEKIHSALDQLAAGDDGKQDDSSLASSWGGWGSSWLSSATASVASVKHTVGQGLTSVIENVESSLGIPSPDELHKSDDANQGNTKDDKHEVATKIKAEEKEQGDTMEGSGDDDGGFFSAFGVSALTSAVEKTVSGGLGALEKIGKKTMDVLQEGDPGLRKKRFYFKEVTTGNKPNLSQLLREAKEDAARAAEMQAQNEELKKAHFGLLFDDYQGLAHLEALEMLSNQSEKKVQAVLGSLSGDRLESMKTELIEIKDAFHLDDVDESQEYSNDEEFVNAITEHLFSLSIGATPDKLTKTQAKAHEWLEVCQKEWANKESQEQKKDVKEIHSVAIQTLAELTAKSIEQFHKASELMLLQQEKGKEKTPIERATSLSKLTTALGSEVSFLSTKFCERLNVAAEYNENPSSVNPLITNVYLEASNSASYIQDAFQLVLPILQIVAIETHNAASQS